MWLSQSLTMSKGDISILFTRPMSLGIFVVMLVFLLTPFAQRLFNLRRRSGEPRVKPA